MGLAPHVDDVVIDDKRFYKKVHTGFDLIYSPWETRFMKLVKENGGHAYNGCFLYTTEAGDEGD